jgi:hypothetical protein
MAAAGFLMQMDTQCGALQKKAQAFHQPTSYSHYMGVVAHKSVGN